MLLSCIDDASSSDEEDLLSFTLIRYIHHHPEQPTARIHLSDYADLHVKEYFRFDREYIYQMIVCEAEDLDSRIYHLSKWIESIKRTQNSSSISNVYFTFGFFFKSTGC